MLGIGYVRREKFTSYPRDDSISYLLLHLFEYKDDDSFTCAKLAWILQMARYREATDQRDKIFGTQGLASRYRMPGDWHLINLTTRRQWRTFSLKQPVTFCRI